MYKIGVVGAGKIGSGIVKGLLEKKAFSKQDIILSDVSENILNPIKSEYGIEVSTNNRDVFSSSKIIILAVKPNLIAPVMDSIKDLNLKEKLIVSVAAGVPIKFIEEMTKETPVIRVMPNISLSIGFSPSCYSIGRYVTKENEEDFKKVFDNLGTVIKVDEEKMDAVTGLSGSGPAYVFSFLKALTLGGIKAGLPEETSKKLALDTLYGAVLMADKTGKAFDELINMVKTPGGTTEKGLIELEKHSFEKGVIEAVKKATERSKELGEVYGKC
ncbi:MAG: pyrroline-5-carboxylate reductase [Candidatus Methanofastidiosum methylothiophilum]|uniref:Pyrroline-5-carboxylate reductase n=1 Tax=Candidatus Methanofastidiosum methylothiophilum TaxID=1705564 RepID=A0A150IM96_9EURY|nr:MAG: pyrroline-5-carboxylate reductase [Candidatus Methanofastidiosum methylthiophilus]KYC48753.1 MAG: pyrroline-5-carboxylate reductase [Candidatus Methanofastidiosum methylthiophilus]KYC51401.1 MAG: pyrroline-5-carboxylate reductase [Candidatus Methanofastidiosum methylthiophilus]